MNKFFVDVCYLACIISAVMLVGMSIVLAH